DVPLFGQRGRDLRPLGARSTEQEITVPLSAGRNKIEVSVVSGAGSESLRETVVVNAKRDARPDLYIVAIGVSAYRDPRLRLTYAAKDAGDVARVLRQRGGGFGRVWSSELLDGDATKDRILAARALLARSRVDDVVVVYLSGHGFLDAKL